MKLTSVSTRLMPLALILIVSSAFAADAPQPMTVGAGTAKFGALLQAWAYDDTTAPTTKFNFRMRRAEMKLAGTLNDDVRWFLMVDPAKNLSATSDNKILQDLGVAYAITPMLEFVLGQFKAPSTAEGYETSAELLFPERAYVARLYGDRRESGALLTFKDSIYRVNAMISNGQRTNVDDTNDKKDLIVRADVTPTESTKFGAFTTAGDYNYGMKSRFGANARFTFGDLLVKGEAVTARDNGIGSHGFSVDSGYFVTERLQPAARYESFTTADVPSHAVTLGLNYYQMKHNAKIQVAYTALRDMVGTNGTYVPTTGSNGSLLTLCFSASL